MKINFILYVCLNSVFLVSCLETEFKESTKASEKPAVEDMQIEFATKVESTGLNVTPYKVIVNVKTPKDYGLFLAKSTDPMAFYGLNSINPLLPPAAIIPLVPVASTEFTYEDVSPTLGVVYYYAVLKKIESAITVSDPNSTATQGLPPPSQIAIPAAPADVYNLNPQVISQSGQKSKIRVNFSAKTYQMYLKIFVNNVEISEVTLSPNSSYYDLNSIDFQKDYKFKLIRRNGMTDIDSSTSTSVAALWPTLNYGTDITFTLKPLATIHDYRIEVKDNTSYGTFYRIFTSVDNVAFNETSYVSENTAIRSWTNDFGLPTTRYIKVSQYDRNDVLMNTSAVFTLTVPLDIYIGAGQIVAGAGFASSGVINVGRLGIYQGQFLLDDQPYTLNADEVLIETCDVINGRYNLTINARKFTSTGCVVQSFSNADYAIAPAAGLTAGDVRLNLTEAYGSITVRNKGQKGFTGAIGSPGIEPATFYSGTCTFAAAGWENFPSNAGPVIWSTRYLGYAPPPMPALGVTLAAGGTGGTGGSGGSSGNSGRVTYWVTTTNSMSITYDNGSVAGGLPGSGGPGGIGQALRPNPGDGTPLIFPPTGGTYCDTDRWGATPRGPAGATGATGSTGASGAQGLRCEKFPGDLVQSCY